MYRYTDSDRGFIRARAAQFRDQLQRHLAGELPDGDFRPLRLQNGWYVQRHAPMLRVAVPYGELSSRQLARMVREFDLQDEGLASERGGFGVLGVDKDGSEWYQVTVGGADGSTLSGPAVPGKVIGPAFAADEVPDVVEAVIGTYLRERRGGERFIETARRLGPLPFRHAADAVRGSTALAV